MPLVDTFGDAMDDKLAQEFIERGYVVRDVADKDLVVALRHVIIEMACEILGRSMPEHDTEFLECFHHFVDPIRINDTRLAIFNGLNARAWCRPSYYRLASPLIDILVGNELAMQNRVNLSIQMPNDPTSVLPAHSDVWSAETPFEVVEWLPLVDVHGTNAMFILPPDKNRSVRARVQAHGNSPTGLDLYKEFESDFTFIEIPFGKVAVFSPILLHGNVLNTTSKTRWSLNSRFTGLFTPYSSVEKTLGNFYLPITPKAVSRIAMNYKDPEGFDD